MKKVIIILLATVLSTTGFSQKVINDANAEKRTVSGFHAIEVSGGIDLYLSQGNESVAVSASEIKYRDRIRTEVKDGVLKIWYEHNSNSNIHLEWGNRKMKAYVSFKNLDKLRASGGSDIDVDGKIKADALVLDISGGSDFHGGVETAELMVDASGGSDMFISGKAIKLKIDASGGSDFKGYDLVTDICKLDASGGSDIYITVNKELYADASGGSDVFYKGEGVIRDLKSGSSSSIKKVSK